ncbi:MAG: hypothetical protein IKC10_05575 [Alphaproteobacteria bacterium]|nr:hypothetical protein [Alphaproteobacteria bacterium]
MSIGVGFEWVGKDVIIRSLSGNYLYTVKNAKTAYYQGGDVIVRGNSYETILFTADGIRRYL